MRFLAVWRGLLERIFSTDKAVHSYIAARFPRILGVVNKVLGGVHNSLSHPLFNLIIVLLLVVLAATSRVSIIVAVSVAAAWAIAVLGIAKSNLMRGLTIPTKLLALLVTATFLAFVGRAFGDWALSQYRVQHQAQRQTAPSEALTNLGSQPQQQPAGSTPKAPSKPVPSKDRLPPSIPQIKPEAPAFHEKIEMIRITLGGDPMSGNYGENDSETVERLRAGKYHPFSFYGYEPIEVHMEGDKLLFSFRVWGGGRKPPIEVQDNEFVIRPTGWDRNSTANALEVVNENNVQVFQMVRRTSAQLVINGIFRLPNGHLTVAWPGQVVLDTPSIPADYALKPIFKYPSWKYPGQYAEQ